MTVLHGPAVTIPACHACGPGSNPVAGGIFLFDSRQFRFSFGNFSGPSARIFMFNTRLERYSLVDFEYYGDILIRSSYDS